MALLAEVAAVNPRRRGRRGTDEKRFLHTLDVLVANLIVAAFNRVDPDRFVAISFNTNEYVGTALSVTALARLRDSLGSLGLVEGRRGYRHVVDGTVRHARKTRLRATERLRDLFRQHGIDRHTVGWSHERDIIVLREPDHIDDHEPADVRASRPTLERINAALSQAAIALPDAAWRRVIARYRASLEGEMNERFLAGDVGSTALYRIFKGGWDRGGRLYGGWWINLPKVERRFLTIDGEPTVERDFARLHPSLLFARCGRALDFDIYSVPGYEGPEIRELGKRTFNRLINKRSEGHIRLPVMPLDRQQLGEQIPFARYLKAFVAQLAPIAGWFGTGEGLRLQREDSDLALGILDALLDRGVLALPVHDSFIVGHRHETDLIEVMTAQFEKRYGCQATIR